MMRDVKLQSILSIALVMSGLLGCGNFQDALPSAVPAQKEGIRVTLLRFPAKLYELRWVRVRISVRLPSEMRRTQIQSVRVRATMLGMSMPAVEAVMRPVAPERYEGDVLFTMRGRWTIHFLLAIRGALYEQSDSIEVHS
ncbi:hypothetical protein AYW79_08680 [Ferroacidibacillus organovorans]|uniref:YtkA-like domain-containing protein n=2 Tax=Ferroacidibacillus organovorans TaxID=1765683 RepID=A0A162TS72_9BACL|nr:hypothetical protein [Ferroacidibacillus organovorans]KYP81079.1 hypothetical protein AYJ22_08715 [Ferroacidibacillus organovorans]OAG93781.1 hypothetical protein AYW79_08680 [Ferroacidibacillus organovorans]OPG17397.1 hypothetical protein B2M26_01280 [Ferroacidibacillus organovorans]